MVAPAHARMARHRDEGQRAAPPFALTRLAGKPKALVVTGQARVLVLALTMAELGHSSRGFSAWFGLMAPAATAASVLAALEAALLRTLATPGAGRPP